MKIRVIYKKDKHLFESKYRWVYSVQKLVFEIPFFHIEIWREVETFVNLDNAKAFIKLYLTRYSYANDSEDYNKLIKFIEKYER